VEYKGCGSHPRKSKEGKMAVEKNPVTVCNAKST
jgi:hypothetical protein